MSTLAVWSVYGDLAALVVAILVVGWVAVKALKRIATLLEQIKTQAAELAAADVLFGNEPAGDVVDILTRGPHTIGGDAA